MTDSDTVALNRLKRIKFRSWHRGMREMDLLMGRFADLNIAKFSEAELDSYEVVLDYNDPDLYNWLSGRDEIPDIAGRDIIIRLKEFTLTR
ncbi:MAG: succinate dehydrogenase assembly factor 2 [Alphaproteobacteria bacterium]|nr:succinate dehydrogenase assembly factor 2 [Alphaproteobacteria bacterium]